MPILLRSGTILTGTSAEATRADVLVIDDHIAKVGTRIDTSRYSVLETVDCDHMLITPGFVNGHIHLNQLLNRGFLNDRSTEDLLHDMHGRHGRKSNEDRYWASLLSIFEGLRCGTTYFSAFATSTGPIAAAMRDARIRGTITVAKKDQWWGEGIPPERKNTEEILSAIRTEIKNWSSSEVAISVGAASDRSASETLLKGITDIASTHQKRIFIHVAEGVRSVELSLQYRHRRPVQYLADIGFLGPNVCLVHAANINEEEIRIIAASGASICHCPISNARTVAGTLPLKKVLGAGIPVGLGTDAASSNNSNNILLEGSVASIVHRISEGDAKFPSAAQVFSMLTVDGAKAVGCENAIGQIRPGFKADLALWDLRQSAFAPNINNPVGSLIYCASEIAPSKVYVNGILVFDKGPLTFSISDALEHVSNYGANLNSSGG